MTRLLKQRGVLRYFYALLTIVAVTGALLLASLLFRYQTDTRARDRLERFHIRSLILVQEVTSQLSRLQQHLLSRVAGRDAASDAASAVAQPKQPGVERTTAAHLSSIEQVLDELAFLVGANKAEQFIRSNARTTAAFDRLRASLLNGDRDETSRELDALAFSITQTGRLHSIVAEEDVGVLAELSESRLYLTLASVAAVMLLAIVIIARLLVLLRRWLDMHSRTEQELLARERQMLEAQKIEALGTLVGGVAHDFNNLLTVILWQVEELIAMLGPETRQREALHEIQQAGERARNLTRQLLLFSRQEAVEPRLLDVNSLIRDVEPLLRRLVREDLSLDIEYGRDLARVLADPIQLEQVLINLTVNARDAMPSGGRQVIRTSQVESCDRPVEVDGDAPGGPFVRITIEDTGTGISEEVRTRMFDPFFTTKEPGKGTGLGLATVLGIVQEAKGSIQVESELGQGTRFHISLPAVSAAPEAVDSLETEGEVAGGTETILVVEDQNQLRKLVTTGLRRKGYQVLTAADGVEGLRRCAEHEGPIHLIVTDVVMPGKRGPEMVAEVLQYHPGAGAVFISGYSEEEVLAQVRESSFPLLPKPFQLQDLASLIRTQLDQRFASV